MMNDLEKLVEKMKDLLYHSKRFSVWICVILFLITVGFPKFMLWIVATTVVFVFVKGIIMLLKMISDK